MIIDTPGTRELGLWADEDAVEESFADVANLSEQCRFRDCLHDKEPGCAVRKAVDDGELSIERLHSFHKQVRETRHLVEKQNDHLRRRREKGFAKVVSDAMKRKKS